MKLPLLILGLVMSVFVNAQELKPQLVSSTSATMAQSNGSLTFTVGELIVQSFVDGSGNTLGNGYIPTGEGSTVITAIDVVSNDFMSVLIYPNPTTDLVQIQIENPKIDSFTILVHDSQGKLIKNDKYTGVSNNIGFNTNGWVQGNYILTIISSGSTIGQYSIIKL